MIKGIGAIVKKEWLSETRNRSLAASLGLYTACSCYIAYTAVSQSSDGMTPGLWNALFWVVILFSLIQSVTRAFALETDDTLDMMRTFVPPLQLMWGKIIYYLIINLLVATTTLLLFGLLFGFVHVALLPFLVSVLMGIVGLTGTLVPIAGIARRVQNGYMLLAVLGIPLILPQLLLLLKISRLTAGGMGWTVLGDELMVLSALGLLMPGVATVLFPYAWRG